MKKQTENQEQNQKKDQKNKQGDKKKLQKLRGEVKRVTEKWKRALADYRNLERRIEKEKEEFVKYSNASLIDKLLEVVDDLERAEAHLDDQGLSMAVDQFRSILQTEGVKQIQAQGEEFDPQTMDCAEMVEGKKDQVIKVVQKGYYLNDKVLRPAKVKVGKGGK